VNKRKDNKLERLLHLFRDLFESQSPCLLHLDSNMMLAVGDFGLLLRCGKVLRCELCDVSKDEYKIGCTNSGCQFTQEAECCTVACLLHLDSNMMLAVGDFGLLLRCGKVLRCELCDVSKDEYKIGCTNSGCQFTQEAECCTVALNVCGIMVWILICHLSVRKKSRWFLHFWKICGC